MKALFIQETDWIDKTVGQHHHLAEMLSLRGHEVRAIDFDLFWKKKQEKKLIASRQIFSGIAKTHQGANVTVIRPATVRIPIIDYTSLLITHKMEIDRQIKEFQPDIIIGFSILNSYLARRAAARHGIPFVYYWIDVLHRIIPQKALRPLGKTIVKRTLRKSDRVLTINDRLRDVTIALGADSERSHVVRAGVDFKPLGEEEKTRVRHEYGLTNDDLVLFFVGWLYHFSGLKEVLHQMARVKAPKLKALIVGEGDAWDDLNTIRDQHGLNDRVILTGKKPYLELPPLINAADICILPAYPEEKIMQDIVPIKIYEYMAMRKPVLVTRLPGIMREFGDNNGVIYIEKPEDTVEKALELTRNGAINNEGAKALRFAQELSWEKVTEEFERILEQAIKEKHDG